MTVEITVTRAFKCPMSESNVFVEGHYHIPKDENSKKPAIFIFAECCQARAQEGNNGVGSVVCDRLPSECGFYDMYPLKILDPYRHAR